MSCLRTGAALADPAKQHLLLLEKLERCSALRLPGARAVSRAVHAVLHRKQGITCRLLRSKLLYLR